MQVEPTVAELLAVIRYHAEEIATLTYPGVSAVERHERIAKAATRLSEFADALPADEVAY